MYDVLDFNYNDGGRSKYFKGKTGDCCCRAVAIATGKDYKEVYDLINELSKSERKGKRKKGISNARTGVYKSLMQKLMKHYGFEWKPCMHIGVGCLTHLRKDEIPMDKTIIVNLSRHFSCIVNGVINDTYDCSRNGTRCVYGYWYKRED